MQRPSPVAGGERKQVLTAVAVKAKHPRYDVEGVPWRASASLLDSRVVVRADAGQRGDLFPP